MLLLIHTKLCANSRENVGNFLFVSTYKSICYYKKINIYIYVCVCIDITHTHITSGETLAIFIYPLSS